MALHLLRGLLLIFIVSVTMLYALRFQEESEGTGMTFTQTLVAMSMTMGIGLIVITVDIFTKKKKLQALSGAFLGLLVGLVVAYVFGFFIDLIKELYGPTSGDQEAFHNVIQGVKVFVGLITCYMGMSLVLQTKDDFRFVIPYIEFSKQTRGQHPILLDTSVIIDGRVLDIAKSNFLNSSLVIPKFVLHELQLVADSNDRLRRARGRRGLEILEKLQRDEHVDVVLETLEVEGSNVDQKLVSAAREMPATIMTTDFNLAKIAKLRGVDVMNLNDLALALRPVVLPGEHLTVKPVKAGESQGQAVAYLEDGTMVVIEKAAQFINEEIVTTATSVIQTSAGRMIFAKPDTSNVDSGFIHPHASGAAEDTESPSQSTD